MACTIAGTFARRLPDLPRRPFILPVHNLFPAMGDISMALAPLLWITDLLVVQR